MAEYIERHQNIIEWSVEQEIADLRMGKPHFVLLGAGASRAALPNGDRENRSVPLLRDVASELSLVDLFPSDLHDLAVSDFEAAYSALVDQKDSAVGQLSELIGDYFAGLHLPDEPTIYDFLLSSLREKDVVFTFNWDPLLLQSHARLQRAGLRSSQLPQLFFLHGNVGVGFCEQDKIAMLAGGGGIRGRLCSHCRQPITPSRLLFPVARKDYNEDPYTAEQWSAARHYLHECFMFTIFGYSAPKTDVEAIDLLKKAWGVVEERSMEQTEIINRPACDHQLLRETWDPFVHTHHFDIFESFFDSWIANHPRRTGEAYLSQFFEAKFVGSNPVPQDRHSLSGLLRWFEPLLSAEL